MRPSPSAEAVACSQHRVYRPCLQDCLPKAGSLAAPELLGRELCAFGQRLKLGPDNLGMANAPAQPAIRPGDDVFATDQPGIPDQALRHQLGVLNEVSGMADDPGNEDLPV